MALPGLPSHPHSRLAALPQTPRLPPSLHRVHCPEPPLLALSCPALCPPSPRASRAGSAPLSLRLWPPLSLQPRRPSYPGSPLPPTLSTGPQAAHALPCPGRLSWARALVLSVCRTAQLPPSPGLLLAQSLCPSPLRLLGQPCSSCLPLPLLTLTCPACSPELLVQPCFLCPLPAPPALRLLLLPSQPPAHPHRLCLLP